MNDEIKLKDMTDFLENIYKDIKKQPTLEEELEKERKLINKIKGDNEDEIKEIYLSNLEWTKTHDNIGGVMGNLIFKDNMPYEEYEKLLKSSYFVLCNKDYITNLQQENQRLSNFIHDFLDYCEECYADNKDSQDYPYCYIQKAEELIKKYKIGECDE